MKLFLNCILYLALIHVFIIKSDAQNNISIKGIIFDKKTNETVNYASIYLKNHAIGTISSLHGTFNFIIPNKCFDDSIIISCIGYKKFKNSLKNIINQQTYVIIYLEKNQCLLQEVVINETKLDFREIINTALEKIKFNYHQESAILDGYYKEYITETVNDELKYRSIDAAVKIYDNGYNKMQSKLSIDEIVKIIGIRKLKNDDFRFGSSSIFQTNFFIFLLKENPLKYKTSFFNKKKNDNYLFKLEKIIEEDNNRIYVIKFSPLDGNITLNTPEGLIYLMKNDFSILKIVFWKPEKNISINKPNVLGVNFQWNYKNVEVYFKKIENYLYLSYIKHNFKVTLTNPKENIDYSLEINTELLINNYETNLVKKLEEPNIMKTNTDLYNQDIKCDNEFWNNYNTITE